MPEMPDGPEVAPPAGWSALLQREPGRFRAGGLPSVETDTTRIRALPRVHDLLLRSFTWTSDLERFGVSDHWAEPESAEGILYGDCEDFCLEARDRLLAEGWHPDCLRLALCKLPLSGLEENHGVRGHMVLTADLYMQGPQTYVLDCLRFRVIPWTAYAWDLADSPETEENGRWISREMPGNRDRWRAIASDSGGSAFR